MKTSQWIGVAMMAVPFIGLFILIWRKEGLKMAVQVFSLTAAGVAFLGLGAFLMTGGM